MSAFIVEDSTINSIVSWLVAEWWKRDYSAQHFFDSLKYRPDVTGEDQRLAEALYDMNLQAVYARYGKSGTDDFKYVHTKRDRIQVFKSIQCLLYQCAEGDVPEKELYKALNKYKRALAESIIKDLEEYKTAKWE